MTPASAGTVARADDIFSRVNLSRAPGMIVDQIRLLIENGELRSGDRLPSERELCRSFGVSRVTLREALRVLEASGLVGSRAGARGRAFLTSPSVEHLSEEFADLLSLSPITDADFTAARIIVENGALPLVVERATEHDVDDLLALVKQGCDALTSGSDAVRDSADFHIRLIECAHNPALTTLTRSLYGPSVMSARKNGEVTPAMAVVSNEEHRQLAHAVRDRDPMAAQAVMSAHLQRVKQARSA